MHLIRLEDRSPCILDPALYVRIYFSPNLPRACLLTTLFSWTGCLLKTYRHSSMLSIHLLRQTLLRTQTAWLNARIMEYLPQVQLQEQDAENSWMYVTARLALAGWLGIHVVSRGHFLPFMSSNEQLMIIVQLCCVHT